MLSGASGQIASYLIEYLLSKGCVVHGISRDRESIRAKHYSQIFDRTGVHLHFGSLEDHHFLNALLADIRPTQIYNLGASSVVNASWMAPVETFQANILGLANVLEAVRKMDLVKTCHVVQVYTLPISGGYSGTDDNRQVHRKCLVKRNSYPD
jgi:GDPmannose 4,6-dehydratase